MGTDIESMLILRNKTLKELIDSIQTWDGELESGIALVEANKVEFDKMRKIDEALNKASSDMVYDQEFRQDIQVLAQEQKGLMDSLQVKKGELLKAIGQVKKRDNVVNSYISVSKKSVFIDKDI